jgi:RNA polymerase sigma-70 factor (ECF subfamily)
MGLLPEAFVQVLLQERARLLAIAVAITGDAHAAEDVFQQVVAAALQAKAAFREREHVLAWALRATRHRALNAARDRRFTPLPAHVLDLLEGAFGDPAGPPVTDHAAALPHCLENLSESARRLVRFRYEEGLSAAAISTRTGRSTDGIYHSLARIHRTLRACVELQLSRFHQSISEEIGR